MKFFELSLGEREQLIRYAASRNVPLGVAADEYLSILNMSRFQDQLAQFLRRTTAAVHASR